MSNWVCKKCGNTAVLGVAMRHESTPAPVAIFEPVPESCSNSQCLYSDPWEVSVGAFELAED